MEYITEEEQLQQLKNWWKLYGNRTLNIVLLIAAALFLYNMWSNKQTELRQQQSIFYQRILNAFADDNKQELLSVADALFTEHPQSIYADYARLSVAKYYIDNDDYQNAMEQYESVINTSERNEIKLIATYRLSRLYIEQKNYVQARMLADQLLGSEYEYFHHELQGDILRVTEQHTKAISAYQTAIDKLDNSSAVYKYFLNKKLMSVSDITS